MLGDLVESVEYVPLETNDKCLIGELFSYDISKNYILVCCNQTKTVYLFKRDGSFVRQIGGLGQGPGEHLGVNDVFIDEDKNEWYCLYNAHDFLEKAAKHKSLSPIISQASSQKYKSLVKKIDPEDNPVLVITKVK